VGERLLKVSRLRSQSGFWDSLFHPVEAPIDPQTPIQRIEVKYPRRLVYLGTTEVNWVAAFAVLTIIFGLILKRPLNVQV